MAPTQESHLSQLAVATGEMGNTSRNLDERGVPNYAKPWIELGKLEERERWQGLALSLMESTIIMELQDLKKAVGDAIPRLPELRQNISSRIDMTHTKITSLLGDYKKLFHNTVELKRLAPALTERRNPNAEAMRKNPSTTNRETIIKHEEKKMTVNMFAHQPAPSQEYIVEEEIENTISGCVEIIEEN